MRLSYTKGNWHSTGGVSRFGKDIQSINGALFINLPKNKDARISSLAILIVSSQNTDFSPAVSYEEAAIYDES